MVGFDDVVHAGLLTCSSRMYPFVNQDVDTINILNLKKSEPEPFPYNSGFECMSMAYGVEAHGFSNHENIIYINFIKWFMIL
jgi:hypothetical protein